MTQSPAATMLSPDGIRLADNAARVLASELIRHGGPKTALLTDADPESTLLAVALSALQPQDRLTLVASDTPGRGIIALRAHLDTLGSWLRDRVTVVASIGEADPADIVIIGEPLTGSADEAREIIDGISKYVADGGVLCVATPARGAGATTELDRQTALFGVGSDLILRHRPPLRVHRLRYSAADPATAQQLTAAERTSSIPLTRHMHIDSNGVAAFGITLGLAALLRSSRRTAKLAWLPAIAAPAVAAFFRDPQRDVPQDPSAVVAASDGKVLSVERVTDDRFGEQSEWLRIAVFLSVLDVHVNRAPVAGRVADYFLTDGGFAAAMKPDAEHNVAAYTVLDTPQGRVVVAQRTGLIARRIVQRAPIGALLAKGERFGLIRFGSRTDIYLPADQATAAVAPGDRVTGGTTVVANWS